jgi:glutamate/aspartate transport system substrate-binding protein
MKVVEALRKQLGRPDLRVEFRPLEAAQRIPLLKAGSIDLECGGNTNTVGRQKEVDFSHTLFTTGVRFLARDSVQLDGAGDGAARAARAGDCHDRGGHRR